MIFATTAQFWNLGPTHFQITDYVRFRNIITAASSDISDFARKLLQMKGYDEEMEGNDVIETDCWSKMKKLENQEQQ